MAEAKRQQVAEVVAGLDGIERLAWVLRQRLETP
mgnify:CR=1 FL=1